MKTKKIYIILCPVLIVFWLFPLFYGGVNVEVGYIKIIVSYLLFLVAAVMACGLPNRHAALVSASVLGAGLCCLSPSAVYDTLPVLLLCCWLRCWVEHEKGNVGRIEPELFTDLIYVCLAAAVIRLISSGYSFIEINKPDMQTIPELCVMAFLLLFFMLLFILGPGSARQPFYHKGKEKKKIRDRSGKKYVGLIPTVISLRTFFGFCALLLSVCLLQYTNSALVFEANLYFRAGFRLLFFPWMVLLFLVLDALFKDPGSWDRLFRR